MMRIVGRQRRDIATASHTWGFNLVELLVVIAIVTTLAALLLPLLARAKAAAHSSTCRNKLRQMGMALKMYVDENQNKYPYGAAPSDETAAANYDPSEYGRFWFAKLAAYYPVQWTNLTYHCPGYHGPIIGILHEGTNMSGPRGSYAYNFRGVRTGHTLNPGDYGLGPVVHSFAQPATAEAVVLVPSEMFAIGESRFLSLSVNKQGGFWGMWCGELQLPHWAFDPARHGKSYNQLFCDGHVAGMNPWLLFNPTNTARLWNYDHQPHPELWTP
jgi:prepilin-type processing-associated H-X9-DG protein/prepilin-type N-terminal cleavage/methylation domain-containing protein